LIRKSRPGRPWGPLWPTSSNFDGENDERLDFWVAQCFLIIPDDLACGWRSLELRMHQGKKALALAVPTCQECMMRPEVDERRLPCDWRGLLKVSELAESFKFVQRLWVCVWGGAWQGCLWLILFSHWNVSVQLQLSNYTTSLELCRSVRTDERRTIVVHTMPLPSISTL
jgi:hypothetical protein